MRSFRGDRAADHLTRGGHVALPVRADSTLRRLAPKVWLGGSPTRLFRMTDKGDQLLGALMETGNWVPVGPSEVSLCDRLLEAGAVHPQPRGTGYVAPGDITVVIPVRDDSAGLAALLADLTRIAVDVPRSVGPGSGEPDAAAGKNEEMAIVVVDDGSRDPQAVRHLAGAHGASLVRHDASYGPSAARNAGLAAVGTAFVAFVDADVRCPAGWLASLTEHFLDGKVVAVAPRVRSPPGSGLLADHERARGTLDLGDEPALVRPGSRVSYVPTAALVARTAAVREAGGFDTRLRFGEDVDLIWRLVESGGTVRYEPGSIVEHRLRGDLRSWMRQRFDYGTSAGELERRHRGALAAVVISPWSAAVWLAVAARRPLTGAVLAGTSAVALARKLAYLPPRVAVRLVLEGHLGAGRQLLRGVIRPWWPLALAASTVSRRARYLLLAAVVAHTAQTSGPPARRLIAVLDDATYSIGVWKGALAARSVGPLVARFPRWP